MKNFYTLVLLLPFVLGTAFFPGTWTKKEAGGDIPPPRSRPVFLAGPGANIFMFGGQLDNSSGVYVNYNDVHIYNWATNTWTKKNPSGPAPAPRVFATGWKSGLFKFTIFGGGSFNEFFGDIQFFNDFWEYNMLTNSWTQLFPEGAENMGTSGLLGPEAIQKGNDVYIFGGASINIFNDVNTMYKYNIVENKITKLNIAGSQPEPRHHTFLIDKPGTNKFIVYMGDLLFGGVRTDMWEFDTVTNTYTQLFPINAPSARQYLTGANFFGDEVVAFGGDIPAGTIGTDETVNETWRYTISTNTWTQLDPNGPTPQSLKRHRIAKTSHPLRMYMFGGFGVGEDTNFEQLFLRDVWEYTVLSN